MILFTVQMTGVHKTAKTDNKNRFYKTNSECDGVTGQVKYKSPQAPKTLNSLETRKKGVKIYETGQHNLACASASDFAK